MHGMTLREIESSLPEPHEQIVDVLGRLLWLSLLHQLPREMFDGRINIGYPSTYLHYTMNAIAHVQTVVAQNSDGDLAFGSIGMTAKMTTDGPPQSGQATLLTMGTALYDRLRTLSFEPGDHQDMCRRIAGKYRSDGEHVQVVVLSTDMARIQAAVSRGEEGAWQSLFREVLSFGGESGDTNR